MHPRLGNEIIARRTVGTCSRYGAAVMTFLKHAPSYGSSIATIRKHLVGSIDLGVLDIEDVSPGKVDLFLTRKERELSAQSVNHLRGFLRRAFNLARRMEKFPRPNPVADVPKRKVPKRLPDYLRPDEVPPLLAAVKPKWRALFATAIYTGLRKGARSAISSCRPSARSGRSASTTYGTRPRRSCS